MKFSKACAVFFALLLLKPAMASHISGGEVFYQYLGPGATPNTDEYQITVRLFRECNSTGQMLNTEIVNIGIFSTPNDSLVATLPLNKLWQGDPPVIQNTPGAIPCLTGDDSLCYQIGMFSNIVDLPKSTGGYTLSWVRCCRQQVTNVQNTPYPDSARGATFITFIPGTNTLPNGFNNSAEFVVKDTVVVCANRFFKLDFSAFDPDNDSLAYTFCNAYTGATLGNPDPLPTNTLMLTPLPYLNPYSGTAPLGLPVTINAQTGFISGIAPAIPGKYVVMVCVQEFRKGVLLNTHHKDFILKIADCDFASAQLNPSYLTCNGFGLQFENLSASASIYSYFWDFGVPGSTTDTSTQPTPFYNFPDSGTFNVKLVVNRGGSCGDSTITQALIYPGFTANFGFAVKCPPLATLFTDSSTTKFGQVASWLWNFGDSSGTSTSQNPSYQYQTPGTRDVTLTVSNTKGCTDTISKQVVIPGPPVLTLAFTDTSICAGDTVQLRASASQPVSFSWLPFTNIIGPGSSSPLVFPPVQTTYYVLATGNYGCNSTAPVTINILPRPTFALTPLYKNICYGDSIVLNASGGNTYRWYPAAGAASDTGAVVTVYPPGTTTYTVIITSNTCQILDSLQATINVTQPFRLTVTKSNDIDCFNSQATLRALGGTQFVWSPAGTLNNPYSPSPVATPLETTTYYVTSGNGSPCTETDSIQVKVITDGIQNGYFLASAFTPNGDGINDCFGVREWGGIKSVQLSVYNRWGNLVYYTNSPSGCWDGTYKGIPQAPGTYVYQVTANTICGQVYRKGTVVLIR